MSRILDWRRVLTEHRIPFVERGANVKRGELNVRCPYCGSADPSYHMGLSLDTGYWACWRNQDHRGKSPVRLLVQLLRISYREAFTLAGLDPGYVDPDGFTEVMARWMNKTAVAEAPPPRTLAFPTTFRDITADRVATRKHWNYLYTRGFPEHDIDALVRIYALKADVGGRYRDRVVLPYYVEGGLVAWTARAVGPAEIRYKDLPLDDCLVPIKQTLYNHDALLDPAAVKVVVVEGPFDALKLDFYGRDWGVRAVALSTNSITEEQIMLLHQHAPKFTSVVVMMDNSTQLAIVDSMRLRQRLAGIPNTRIDPVPQGAKDAGELTPRQALLYCRSLAYG